MGLLTSFHILFDIPKEDIGNSNQPERGREDRKDISGIPADCLQRNIRFSSKQAGYHSESLERPSFHTACTVLYLLHLIFPSSNRGEIVYCIPIEPDECPRITKASQSVSLSRNLNPITKQIPILTSLLSELRESITPLTYHCDHGLDSGILQLDYMYLTTYLC